jgi:hypothetical protein
VSSDAWQDALAGDLNCSYAKAHVTVQQLKHERTDAAS